MADNADRYAANSRPDKVRFIFRGMEPEQAVETGNRWVEWLMDYYGWSEGYARRHCRVMPYHRGAERKGVIFQLTYRATELCYTLALSWMARINEVEMKTYLEGKDATSYDAFLDAMLESEGRLAMHVYFSGAHSAPKKGKRTRKMDLGSRKSESNVKAYKRPGERPGLEVTARGKAVKKIATETAEYAQMGSDPDTTRALWTVFFARCARFGFRKMTPELIRRRVDLSDYFLAFTSIEDEGIPVETDESNEVEPMPR